MTIFNALELSGFVSLDLNALFSILNDRKMESIVLAEGSVQIASDFSASFQLNELSLVDLEIPSGCKHFYVYMLIFSLSSDFYNNKIVSSKNIEIRCSYVRFRRDTCYGRDNRKLANDYISKRHFSSRQL